MIDYEKKYNEALERAKHALDCDKAGLVTTDRVLIESMFPELKESEDEKIRKAILTGLIDCRDAPDLGWSNFGGINIDECIAWLEMQEQVKESSISKHENEMCKENNDSLTSKNEKIMEIIRLALKSCNTGQGYIVCNDDYTKCLEWLENQDNNNNQNWKPSKGQINALEHFVKSIEESGYASPYDNNTKLLVSLLHDLEKLEKQGENKSTWSEDDERLWQCIISDQEEALDKVRNSRYGHAEIISDLKEMYNERIEWLKSLKERLSFI